MKKRILIGLLASCLVFAQATTIFAATAEKDKESAFVQAEKPDKVENPDIVEEMEGDAGYSDENPEPEGDVEFDKDGKMVTSDSKNTEKTTESGTEGTESTESTESTEKETEKKPDPIEVPKKEAETETETESTEAKENLWMDYDSITQTANKDFMTTGSTVRLEIYMSSDYMVEGRSVDVQIGQGGQYQITNHGVVNVAPITGMVFNFAGAFKLTDHPDIRCYVYYIRMPEGIDQAQWLTTFPVDDLFKECIIVQSEVPEGYDNVTSIAWEKPTKALALWLNTTLSAYTEADINSLVMDSNVEMDITSTGAMFVPSEEKKTNSLLTLCIVGGVIVAVVLALFIHLRKKNKKIEAEYQREKNVKNANEKIKKKKEEENEELRKLIADDYENTPPKKKKKKKTEPIEAETEAEKPVKKKSKTTKSSKAPAEDELAELYQVLEAQDEDEEEEAPPKKTSTKKKSGGTNPNVNANLMKYLEDDDESDEVVEIEKVPEEKPAAPARKKWICSACGAENIGKFCMECGAPAPAPKKPTKWTCECGQVNTGKFCMECGCPAPAEFSTGSKPRKPRPAKPQERPQERPKETVPAEENKTPAKRPASQTRKKPAKKTPKFAQE